MSITARTEKVKLVFISHTFRLTIVDFIIRDIFQTLHVRVRDPFEGHRFSVNI